MYGIYYVPILYEEHGIYACCGINVDEYAFAYGKHFAKPHLNCGVVIDGRLPIIEFME